MNDDRGPVAPDWRSILVWAANRLRFDILSGSVAVGLTCVGIGTVLAVLAFWPAAIWLPFFTLAAGAGILAMCRGRVVAGFGCCSPSRPSRWRFRWSTEAYRLRCHLRLRQTRSQPPLLPSEATHHHTHGAHRSGCADQAATRARARLARETESLEHSGGSTGPQRIAGPCPTACRHVAANGRGKGPKPSARFSTAPAAAPSEPAGAAPAPSGDLVQRFSNALVLIKDNDGAGSGFICKSGSQVRLLTNIHVMAATKKPQFTALNGAHIDPGAGEAAVDFDIFRMVVTPPPGDIPEIITNLESNVRSAMTS